jgi:hypothetical protein
MDRTFIERGDGRFVAHPHRLLLSLVMETFSIVLQSDIRAGDIVVQKLNIPLSVLCLPLL